MESKINSEVIYSNKNDITMEIKAYDKENNGQIHESDFFKVIEKNGFSSICEFAVRNVIDSIQSYSGGMISLDNAQLAVIKISELFKTDLVEDEKENLEIKEVTIHSISKIISIYDRRKTGKIHIEDFYKAMNRIGCGFACKLVIYEVANSIEKISGGFITVDTALKAVVKLAKIFHFFRIKM